MSEFQIYVSPSPNHSYRGSPSRLSPSPDRDFYTRKCNKLTQELHLANDELNQLRVKCIITEDYHFKYQALLAQNHNQSQQTSRLKGELLRLVTKNEQLVLLVDELGRKGQYRHSDTAALMKDLQIWKEKALQGQQKLKTAYADQEYKIADRINSQARFIRSNFQRKEEQYKQQLTRLQKQYAEGQSQTKGFWQKLQRLRKEKDQQIDKLEGIIETHRQDYMKLMQTKNKEIQMIKDKFEAIFNQQIGNLQNSINSQDKTFSRELAGLKELLQLKNQDIRKLQQQLRLALEAKSKERADLNAEIALLKQKIYDISRSSQQELFSLKQRLGALHAADINKLQEQYQGLLEGLRDQNKELRYLMSEKDKDVAFRLKEFERIKADFEKIIKDRNETIMQLKDQHSKKGESSSNQVNNLNGILNQLKNQKQNMNHEYQTNVAFLRQQITKLTTSNDLKNNQIRQLHQYNALLKKEHFQSLKQLQAKWKSERKQRENQREQQRQLRQKVQQELRQFETESKNRNRQLEMELQKERRTRNKQSVNNQELSKQVLRLTDQNKQLQQTLMAEIHKNQRTVINTGDAKRQFANELQRQKNDLQVLKRMQVDQIRKQSQLEITRLGNQNQQLLSDLQTKKLQFARLQEQFKKVSGKYKNSEKLNREKIADYNKKMATLSSEILLTQNLYQSLIDARTKVHKKQ